MKPIVRELIRASAWVGALVACVAGLGVACEGDPQPKPVRTHVVDPLAPIAVARALTAGDRYTIAQSHTGHDGGADFAGTITVKEATPYWAELDAVGTLSRGSAGVPAEFHVRVDLANTDALPNVRGGVDGANSDELNDYGDTIAIMLWKCVPPHGPHIRGDAWSDGDTLWKLTGDDPDAGTVSYTWQLDTPDHGDQGGTHDHAELALHTDDGFAGKCRLHRHTSVMSEGLTDDYEQTITKRATAANGGPARDAIVVGHAFVAGDRYHLRVSDGGVLDGIATVTGVTDQQVTMQYVASQLVNDKPGAPMTFMIVRDRHAAKAVVTQTAGPTARKFLGWAPLGAGCDAPAGAHAPGDSWQVGSGDDDWAFVGVAPDHGRALATFHRHQTYGGDHDASETTVTTLALATDDGFAGTCDVDRTYVIMHEGHSEGFARAVTRLPRDH